MEFVESPFFTKLLRDYLSDEDYAALQQFLARATRSRAISFLERADSGSFAGQTLDGRRASAAA